MVLEQLVVNGIIAGSEYALLAIGLTLIFRILRIIHFAHGEVAMVRAYAALIVCAALAVSSCININISHKITEHKTIIHSIFIISICSLSSHTGI